MGFHVVHDGFGAEGHPQSRSVRREVHHAQARVVVGELRGVVLEQFSAAKEHIRCTARDTPHNATSNAAPERAPPPPPPFDGSQGKRGQ